jgi:hypothetical protein
MGNWELNDGPFCEDFDDPRMQRTLPALRYSGASARPKKIPKQPRGNRETRAGRGLKGLLISINDVPSESSSAIGPSQEWSKLHER